uniref:Uncharacterized protein n=1 Tax=Rhinopithecus bieti TaxID=61621 RepID=A0A2K6KPQ3_RHIBE
PRPPKGNHDSYKIRKAGLNNVTGVCPRGWKNILREWKQTAVTRLILGW